VRDRDALCIDGAWTSPLGDGVIAAGSPATEETLAGVPEGTAEAAAAFGRMRAGQGARSLIEVAP